MDGEISLLKTLEYNRISEKSRKLDRGQISLKEVDKVYRDEQKVKEVDLSLLKSIEETTIKYKFTEVEKGGERLKKVDLGQQRLMEVDRS